MAGAWSGWKASVAGLSMGLLIVGCTGETRIESSSATPDDLVVEEDPSPVDTSSVATAPSFLQRDLEELTASDVPDLPLSLPAYQPQSDEVSFRFHTYLGGQMSEPDLIGDFDVTLLASGQVVLVEGTSIYDGAESYVTWHLSESGYGQLADYVLDHPLTGQQFGSNDRAYSMTHRGMVALEAHPRTGAVDEQTEASLHELAGQLRDHSWLGAEVISGPEPWVPSDLEFSAQPGLPETHEGAPRNLGEPVIWPLDRTIGDIGLPAIDRRGRNVLAICLTGDEAAAAWGLVREGINHAWIPVSDGRDWTLSYQIRFPGYSPPGLC